jgi:hypothetical protein
VTDDNIPFSEIREKVRAERQDSDSEEDKAGRVPLSFLAGSLKKTPRTSWTADDVVDPNIMVGCKIARDFGERGVYLGEVMRIEYDSEDEDKVSIKTICTSF